MTSHQRTSRPPTSSFIELRPRTRHTISVPPLPLADTVSDFQKAIIAPVPPLPCAQIPMLQSQPPMKTTSTIAAIQKLDEDKGLGASLNVEGKKAVVVGLDGEEMVRHSPASSSSSVSGLSEEKKPIRSSMMNERKIRRIIGNSSTPQEEIALLKDAAKMGVSDDGNPDDSTHSHSDTEPADFGQSEPSSSPSPSDIYVSIYDPAGGAFVPSKTKPLPKWMTLLPNNVHREREESNRNSPSNFSQRKAGAVVSRATLPDSYADGTSSIHSEDCTGEHNLHTSCPTEEGSAGFFTQHSSGNVTPKAIDKYFSPSRINSDKTSDNTRRPSTIQSHSTISSLTISSPNTKAKKTTTRPRSVSIEEKLPRPHQHSASAYRRANRSSTIESSCLALGNSTIHGNLAIQDPIQVVQPMDNPPRDVSERPLTPYPKHDDPFQATNGSGNGKGRVEGSSILTSPLSNFITPRKGSCCGLSTSLESGGVGELRKRDRGVSSFDNTFESFPVPEIGKNNNNYALSMSPKLGVLGMGTEYLERCGVLSGREKGEARDGGGEKEGIVEMIRRQRVGTVSLGQVAQNVKEEKERKRAETQSQSEWEWMESGGKDFEDKPQARSRTSLRRSRGVASETNVKEEKAELPMSSKRSSRRGRVTSEGGSEESGSLTRDRSNGSRKRKERERVKIDVKGKGKLLEEDDGAAVETEVSERGKRETLRRELKTLFGEE
ncbi:hypothetical protein EYC80_002264 [Monilinia laxa]|uniref:Uncharacterized protein n=1 Tax=Monilinia laxa TaxID=61186 RepID=A0A5N6K3H0_MONLA|nr:hypothetical protein EYC80_002264 [Monilinia laxa]